MPYGKKRKYSKKRKYRKKRRASYKKRKWLAKKRKFNKFPLGGRLIQNTKAVCLRYNATVTLDITALGLTAWHVFRANSIFDPDLTGLGHQPLYRDSWAQFYNKYTVVSAKMVAEFVTQYETKVGQYWCATMVSDDPSDTPVDVTTLKERGKPKYTCTLLAGRDAVPSVRMVRAASSKRVMGVTNVRDDPNYQATMASNPASTWFMGVGVYPVVPAEDNYAIQVNVTLYQNVILSDPIDQAQS